MQATIQFLALAATTSLPPAVRPLVENLPGSSRPIISTQTPRFSFLPHSAFNHLGNGVAMSGWRITVSATSSSSSAAAVVLWDSGKVAGTACVNARPNVTLPTNCEYAFHCQYWVKGDANPSNAMAASATGHFIVAPAAAEWKQPLALGGGDQTEFQLPITCTGSGPCIMYVASPGGAVAYVDNYPNGLGAPLGRDDVGLSAWYDFSKSVRYTGFELTPPPPASSAGFTYTVRLLLGHGFWSSKYTLGADLWSPGARHDGAFAHVLVVNGEVTSLSGSVKGRSGSVRYDDPWMGSVMDHTMDDARAWDGAIVPPPAALGDFTPLLLQVATAKTIIDDSGVASRDRSLSSAHATRKMATNVTKVEPLGDRRYLYTFNRNIVGHAAVRTAAIGSTDGAAFNVTIHHCESVNRTGGPSRTRCADMYPFAAANHRQNGLLGFNQSDVHMVIGGAAVEWLRPKFTWHGFQYAIVEITGDASVDFDATANALDARWTTVDVDESATIEFSGPGAALLGSIRDITKASQISNVAAYVPTDCPTREKHGWMGDGMVTAEEAMYNLWAPPIWEMFIDEMQREIRERNASDPWRGFVPEVLPSDVKGLPDTPPPGSSSSGSLLSSFSGTTAGNDAGSGGGGGAMMIPPGLSPPDLSWSTAYPLITFWLHWYYGDDAIIKRHWSSLVSFMDAQVRQATAVYKTAPKFPKYCGKGGLPCFWRHGDWCSPIESRTVNTKGTGPISGAGNFILAVEAMVKMANAIGNHDEALRFANELVSWKSLFHDKWWNATAGTYTNNALEVQTISSLALAMGVAPDNATMKSVEATLVHAVESATPKYSLGVGAVGQKFLLQQLSESGHHDEALQVALQTAQPSWGYWIAQGATTCWESWSGVADPMHPPPPTHNHIFLCGGIGEWMYKSLAGIVATSAGYATVDVAPKISPTLGPSGVNASVSTIRGVVKSSWTRHDTTAATLPVESGSTAGSGGKLQCALTLTLRVTVPVGIEARVVVPLMGRDAKWVAVDETSNAAAVLRVYGGGAVAGVAWLRAPPRVVGDGIEIATTAGVYEFQLCEKK